VKRGDIVIVSAPGDYGKPRPAVVIQSDKLQSMDSILVSLITSMLVEAPLFRLSLEPSEKNGLKQKSQIMVDKIVAMPRAKCVSVIGNLERQELITLNHMLAVVIGIAD
jgi:mRNA interferase MazF